MENNLFLGSVNLSRFIEALGWFPSIKDFAEKGFWSDILVVPSSACNTEFDGTPS